MARFTKQEKEAKISYAKKLYVKGFDLTTIADMLGVTASTISKWSKDNDFETAKRASMISINEIRNAILETYEQMKAGNKPVLSPDQISKLVSSFEKLSPSQKSITWVTEGFEELTESFLQEIQHTKSEKKKDVIYKELQAARKHMDRVLARIHKEILQ